MVSLKLNKSCVVLALVFIVSVGSAASKTRRDAPNQNGSWCGTRSMSGKWKSQNAAIRNVGATFPGYAQGIMADHHPSNVMYSQIRRSPRSRRSLTSQFRNLNPMRFPKQFLRAQKRMMRFRNFGKYGRSFANNLLPRTGLLSLGKSLL